MSVNKNKPHIFILPEDDANHRIATGFLLSGNVSTTGTRVLPVAGGSTHVVTQFERGHIAELRRWPARFLILLIDFDAREDRLSRVKQFIPGNLYYRFFVLGAWREPEDLKKQRLGSYEEIGQKLANDCREKTAAIWNHELLRHNGFELQRLNPVVRPILLA